MTYPSLAPDILKSMMTSSGQTLWDISNQKPTLLVFLRHFGCTFCREALSDLSKKRTKFLENGFELVLVHMSDLETSQKYFFKYNLSGVIHISDPECKFYAVFGLVKGTFQQLFGWSSWIRGFQSTVLEGHGIGPLIGDGFQMPGVFVLKNGEVARSFVHEVASDRPDYESLILSCTV
jgi:peroxiredoxin